MFGSSPKDQALDGSAGPATTASTKGSEGGDGANSSSEKRAKNESPQGRSSVDNGEKKRRSSGVGSKASSFLQSAKSSLHFSPNPNASPSNFLRGSDSSSNQTPLQKLGKQDPALVVPQGQHNNSAGESHPTARSTFSVGVWEDRNKKCRRTMEDTHAFLYNFLQTPSPALGSDTSHKSVKSADEDLSSSTQSLADPSATEMVETDNGYFAIFDGHAGTFAADWCGKKLHLILEDIIRKNPNTPIPELLDQTFTAVDNQLEKLPLKNSGCTAVTAVLRWEDRIPNSQSATGSTAIAPATAAAVKAEQDSENKPISDPAATESISNKLKSTSSRQRVLYTANVGDARIVLCRAGKALRLSYDHKGSDENEGKRVANAGGLILNNRVNGVLAVTRALGDAYMKDLVTGHPYTTETVIQADLDEFIILACDGLWDVCTDQEAVDLIRGQTDPSTAAKALVEHALARFSTDNLSCMVIRLNRTALLTASKEPDSAIGVEGDSSSSTISSEKKQVSEAEKIVAEAKRKVDHEGASNVGVSGSNSGKGHDQQPLSPRESTDDSPGPLSPNANPLAASTATGEIPVLNEPPPPKNLPQNTASASSDDKDKELSKVVEEDDADDADVDSKEVDLKGGELASPETRKSLSLPFGARDGAPQQS